MKIRSDSPFAKISEEGKIWILEMSEVKTLEKLTEFVEVQFGIETTDSSVQRFLARLKTERLVADAKDKQDDLEELAELGKKSNSREATLELARQKLLGVAATSGESEELVEVIKTL